MVNIFGCRSFLLTFDASLVCIVSYNIILLFLKIPHVYNDSAQYFTRHFRCAIGHLVMMFQYTNSCKVIFETRCINIMYNVEKYILMVFNKKVLHNTLQYSNCTGFVRSLSLQTRTCKKIKIFLNKTCFQYQCFQVCSVLKNLPGNIVIQV